MAHATNVFWVCARRFTLFSGRLVCVPHLGSLPSSTSTPSTPSSQNVKETKPGPDHSGRAGAEVLTFQDQTRLLRLRRRLEGRVSRRRLDGSGGILSWSFSTEASGQKCSMMFYESQAMNFTAPIETNKPLHHYSIL